MAIIKTPVLLTLGRMLGLSPSPSPLLVDDTNVSLTLPIVPDVARRGGAGIREGWFVGLLENVHAAADAKGSAIDPYNAGVDAIAPYPEKVPDGFDLWLLALSGTRSAGAGTLTGAIFTMNPPDTAQGFGRDDAGSTVLATPSMRLAHFDGLVTDVTVFVADPMVNSASGKTWEKIGIRIPRGGNLGMETESGGAATFQGQFLVGLFPAGLGQDVVT